MSNKQTSLADLIQRVRWRVNVETNQIVTDSELTYYINGSLAELDGLIVGSYEDYKKSLYTFTITDPASNLAPLPADFLKGRGLDRQVSGVWMTVDLFQQPARNEFNFPSTIAPYGFLGVFYRIEDGYVELIPAQSSLAVYRLHYIPDFIMLVNTTDKLPSYMDKMMWCDYAVTDCLIKVQAKQDLDTSVFERQKAEFKQRIMQELKPRDAGPPKTVQNVRRYNSSVNPWGKPGG